jgi:hypothetical protein
MGDRYISNNNPFLDHQKIAPTIGSSRLSNVRENRIAASHMYQDD